MVTVEVIVVKSFTSEILGGNPAGVVLNPGQLTDKHMKMVSKQLGVSETAFVFPCKSADYKIRFFSPAVEVDLCGHATIAAFTVLGRQYENQTMEQITLTQETKAGILPVQLYYSRDKTLDYVLMKQRQPKFEPVTYDAQLLAEILKIPVDLISDDFPKQRVSTGLFTLPVCVKSLQILEEMAPDFQRVKQFCMDLKVGSLHVFTFETYDSGSLYHARNFAPIYDINEDPVTGTANGAVCSFLRHHHSNIKDQLICEQGDIIGKKGRVRVRFFDDEVWVGGKAVIHETDKLKL